MLRASDKRVFVGDRLSSVGLRSFPAPQFETLGAAASGVASGGTSVSPNTSANTKGAAFTELDTATIDADGFYLIASPGQPSADYLLDIGFGGAGSETVIIANFLVSCANGGFGEVVHSYIPIPVPAGTRVSARCQATGASSAAMSSYVVLAKGEEYYARRKHRATTYGAATGDSGGVSIDPGAAANTDGGWVQLSAAITNPIESAVILIGNQTNTARTDASMRCDIGWGAAASEVLVCPAMLMRAEADHDSVRPGVFERTFSVAAGQRLVARGRSSITDATDRLFDIVVIGFD